MSAAQDSSGGPTLEDRLFAFLSRPRLHYHLFALALLLSTPALFSGYRLDDYIARYIYTDEPLAERLFDIWSGGYGAARGIAEENHWLVEEGWAPYWITDDLLIRLYRPIGVLSHRIDAFLWPDTAFLSHLHSLLWAGLLALAMTRLYRSAMGPLLGGMAALLFAVDHTHGFTVGYICNRHALISAIFASLCLSEHLRYRRNGERRGAITAPVLLLLGLLTSESTIAVMGYLGAFALFADEGSLIRRGLTMLPYLVVMVAWRVAYTAAGYGAHDSGMYLDPGLEPVAFLGALLKRGPVLLLGQYLAPPAEAYLMVGPEHTLQLVAFAGVFVIALLLGLSYLLLRDRDARFWLAGSLLSMVPAASAYPHNRQLMLVSFGSMALIAKLWHLHAVELKGKRPTRLTALSGAVGTVVLFAHLIASPLALPLASFSPAFTAPLHLGITTVGDEIADKEAVFLTAPDYFAVKLIQLDRRVRGAPLPRHFRGLHFGPEQVTVHRTGERSLTLDIAGGILTDHILELYRDRRIPTPVGPFMSLDGLNITIEAVTAQGLAKRVRFDFDRSLSDASFCFYYWQEQGGFARLEIPSIGEERALPPATMTFGL